MDRPIIILISGKRYAGKDTLGQALAEHHAITRVHFADSLKQQYAKRTGADYNRLQNDAAYKECHRAGLIKLAADEREIDPACWAKYLYADIGNTSVVICDWRYPNEHETVPPTHRVITIRVNADNNSRMTRGWTHNPTIDDHISETLLDDYPADIVITNSTSADNATAQVIAEVQKILQ